MIAFTLCLHSDKAIDLYETVQAFGSWNGKWLTDKNCDIRSNNTVVTFQVLCKNEQNYAEVVDLMNSYGDHIVDIYRKANLNVDGLRVHISGDQLIRERFCGVKRVAQPAATEREDLFICHQLLLIFDILRSHSDLRNFKTP